MNPHNPYFEANRELWNQRTAVHADSGFYNLAGFREGKSSLTTIEKMELGDVKGKTLLHLQCHFGMDTLSWAREGAVVTGLDFSEAAIAKARELSRELGIPADFICCNVYDTHLHLKDQFDIVYSSFGVIGWLPDLDAWARQVSQRLKPGGIFYLAEFHPVVWMFDDDFTQITYSYENREIIITENQGTYTDRNADIKGKEYSWNHSISEVLNALLHAGLQLRFFNEYMYSPYPCFRNITETSPGEWQIKGLEGKIPMVYSLGAVK